MDGVFSLCSHMVKGTQQLSCLRALIPLMRAPRRLLKPHLPLALGFRTWALGPLNSDRGSVR